jgi:hypothetical protein
MAAHKPFWRTVDGWNAVGTVVIACFTVALVAVGCLQANILTQTDETQRTIQRAFVLPRPIEIVGLQKHDPKDVMLWEVNVNWENTGSTAPRELTLYTEWHVENGTDAKPAMTVAAPPSHELEASGAMWVSKYHFTPITPAIGNWPKPPHQTTLGPHQIRIGDQSTLSAGSMKRLQSGAALAAIIGIASYQDAFGKKRVTIFCQHFIVPDIDYDNGEPDKPHTANGPDCQDYNCTDDDCSKYKGATWLPADVIP